MFLAPTPSLTGARVPLPGGTAGVWQTLRVMRNLVNAHKTDPAMIQRAVSIVWTVPQKDELAEVAAVFEFVRDSIRYVRDVAGVETLCSPDKTLERRVGDCDDQATLLATLLEAVGYPTRFVVAAYSHPRELEHVYLQVFADGQWIDADPTESGPLGHAPPDPLAVYHERV